MATEQRNLADVWSVVRASGLGAKPHTSTLLGVPMLGYSGQLVDDYGGSHHASHGRDAVATNFARSKMGGRLIVRSAVFSVRAGGLRFAVVQVIEMLPVFGILHHSSSGGFKVVGQELNIVRHPQ